MITALFGFAYAAVLMQGDVFREHIKEQPIIMYSGQDWSSDPASWLYTNRQSRFVVGGVEWTPDNQYHA